MSITVPLYGFGGGGNPLNFKVVGGTTEPSNAKENMIWVNTDTEITSWVFSAEQPSSPSSGMVWVQTGVFSNAAFNGLKKNGIQVNPLSAKQYVGSSFKDKTAKSYQSGVWVEWWNGELYYKGQEYESLTGGWSTFNHHSYTFNDSQCSKSDGKLTLKLSGTKSSVAFGTKEAVDLTNYTAIEFTVDTIYTECAFAVSKNRDTSAATNTAAKIVPNASGVHSLDISKITGKYYVWFGDFSTGAAFGAVVSKVRLVK